jgi:hypothetical protein
MTRVADGSANFVWRCGLVVVLLVVIAGVGAAQKVPEGERVWSVGPLVKPQAVESVAFGNGGATFSGMHVDSQTGSTFAATRSVVFAGDRIVVAANLGMRTVEGRPTPVHVCQLLSLDGQTGEVKDRRDFPECVTLPIFATNDGHGIVSGHQVLRLTPDLKDEGSFDYGANGHKHGRIQNISPDGSTLGNETSPGFELVDARTLRARQLTGDPAVDTSVSSKGFVTDNIQWTGQYPKEIGFVTYVDAAGSHLLYHGRCGGRPQFLSDDLILEPGCKDPLIIDTQGKVVRTLAVNGRFSFAGVSQNGKRMALQIAKVSSRGVLEKERFVIYSVENGEAIAEAVAEEAAEEQSWTGFSADGAMFVVGSPLKLTLYRLP